MFALKPVASIDKLDHARPPLPVELVRSNVKELQPPMTAGAEMATVGATDREAFCSKTAIR